MIDCEAVFLKNIKIMIWLVMTLKYYVLWECLKTSQQESKAVKISKVKYPASATISRKWMNGNLIRPNETKKLYYSLVFELIWLHSGGYTKQFGVLAVLSAQKWVHYELATSYCRISTICLVVFLRNSIADQVSKWPQQTIMHSSGLSFHLWEQASKT